MPETTLGGRYQVQDRIGTGGMATVYRGLDEVLGRTVAIKTMLPQYATDPSFAARFKQEAQAAAALQSPYIVSVYDWGKDADTYYIVMEYLRGTDLKSGIKKHGALDCKKVAQIGSQIAQALSVAHKHDIIHRDIKPQNIMVQPDGNIKVMDFGIARAKNSHLTQDNSVLGTAHYVSPEQTQGKELGPTTDIYSLGIVMYEAATGQVPFQGDDAISVALKQVNEQPKPPSLLNPAVDPALEAIILKCMQKDPAERFQTADELYRTLRDYLAGRTQAVNAATATMVVPAAATRELAGGAAGMRPAVAGQGSGTAAMPRVERASTGHYRPQSATELAEEREAEQSRKHRRNIVLGVVALLVVAAIAVFGVMSALNSGTKMAEVPNLLECTQEEAVAQIKAAGFDVAEVKTKYDSSVAEGLVCDQDPLAYRSMPEGTQITIWLSLGEEEAEDVTVPDVRGMTAQEAAEELRKYNLIGQPGDDVESDEYESGQVAEQEPAAGETAKAGSTVTYHLSKGASQEVIPTVSGDSLESATERLEKLEFVVKPQYIYSDDVAAGNVVYTSPEEGESADKGSTVTVYVSNGSKPIDVPNVYGYTLAEAKETLTNAGFMVTLTTGSSDADDAIVIGQTPSSGTATKGTTITLSTQAATPVTPDNGGDSNTSTNTNSNTGGDTTTP